MMLVKKAENEDLPEVEAFLRSQASLCAGWDHKGMIEWLRWMKDAVLVGGAWENGKLVALCIGRPTDDPFKCSVDHYYLKREGDTIWIDFFGGKLREHAVKCLQLTFEHWGWKWPDGERWIAFNRNLLGRKQVMMHRTKDICRLI